MRNLVLAILSLTAIAIIAMLTGHDGMIVNAVVGAICTNAVVGAICTIAGYSVGKRRGNNGEKPN